MTDNKLHEYLQPILGSACTAVAIERLESFHPELKDNDDLQTKFIKEIEKVPDEDKNYMVAAALKISKIREVLNARGFSFEYVDAYKDFENITTRLLKNFYNIGKYADSRIFDETLSDEEKLGALGNPIYSARTIVLNDGIDKNIKSVSVAKNEMNILLNSAAGGMNDFPNIVQYIAEKSGHAAEIIFNHKEFRNFSEWLKDKAVQDAKQEALTGVKKSDSNRNIKTGNEYE